MSERPSVRVLVVGRPPVVESLGDAGFSVRAVDGVEAAVAALADVDGIVTDVELPDGDGFELLSSARDLRPGLPVVFQPSEGSERLASEAFAAGADDYVATALVGDLPARVERAVARGPRGSDAGRDRSYRRLVETVGDMVYTVDEEGYITMVNEAAVDVSGYTREELVGEHVGLLLSERDMERGREVVQSLLRGDRETAAYGITIETKDGRRVPMENHVALLPGDGSRGTVGVVRDTSEARERDRRLRELHDATRELMAATTREAVAEVTADAAGDVLDYPIHGVRLYDETAGTLDPVAVPIRTREAMGERPPYRTDGDTPAAEAYRRGEPVVHDDVGSVGDHYDRGGVRAAMYLPLGEHGVLSIGATEPAAFDDSDRQLAEVLAANATAALDRVEQRRELAAEHDRLTALFENIPDPAVYVEYVDGEPIVRDVNARFEETFGYTAAELEGESVDDYVVPPERDREADRYNAEIQSGDSLHAEVRRLAADGPRDFLLHVVPHETDAHNTRGFGIYTDITERRDRERELERQNERLEEFASVVSHDLRNPLNVAQGRLGLARETGDDAHFDAVERAHDRMERLIGDLLALARQGREVGETEPVDIERVARAAWESVDTDGSRLVAEELSTVRADKDRLQQLFENLFRNAVEHGATGRDGGVTVTVGPLGDGFYVADDGVGIDPDRRDRVFESGFTTSEDGTGFGLAIVKGIAEAHGWTVAATESPSGGAAFEVTGVESAELAPQDRS